MHTHLKRCKENPHKEGNKRPRTAGSSSQTVEGQIGCSPTYLKFDQEACRKELVRLFVRAEIPFRFVENEAFRDYHSVVQPRFSLPSRSTLTLDIWTLFNEEKVKLKTFLSKNCGRVCLTTDTWTSIQNINYMSLTAHFIDKDWNLHKKLLNFCQVTGHSGELMAKNIDICLNDWELDRVLSLTVDNASSNDLCIQLLKKRLTSSAILKGEYVNMRCCAHILNLIVKEGLKEIDDSILRIRCAVKYIRSSSSRLNRFKACVEREKLCSKSLVCLDVETRWNSAYLMLEAALKHQKAFELMEIADKSYIGELIKEKGKGIPTEEDWDYARSVLPFLKIFFDSTMHISGSSYITSNAYMKEVYGIGRKIRQYAENDDPSIKLMATRMKRKYDKYGGNPNAINILLLIAIVLDPRHKLGYVNYFLDFLFDEKANELKLKLTSCLRSLYEHYQGIEEGSVSNQEALRRVEEEDDFYGVNQFLKTYGLEFVNKSELDIYLKEELVSNKLSDFNILNWWNVNSPRFPTLAKIAREVLAIPVSTVASEAAFSTGGRVLDPYRSSLTPAMVEALVCIQDWLKGKPLLMLIEDFEELEGFEQERASQYEGASSTAINLGD